MAHVLISSNDRGTYFDLIKPFFEKSTSIIRIGTGFFTVAGYGMIRKYLKNKQVQILVGIDEPGKELAKKALVQDLIKEIIHELAKGGDEERRQSVQNLVDGIQNKSLQIIDVRAIKHHGKYYIIDDKYISIGSSNLTVSGLSRNLENNVVSNDKELLKYQVKQFLYLFEHPDAKDVTQELLNVLLRWLEMVSPFDVYLKTLDTLRSLKDTHLQTVRPDYKSPVDYQKAVIARALRQLEEYRGAIVVASVGLGKTVIGTDIALRLQEANLILNAIVIGPKPVKNSWGKHLFSAGVSYKFFTFHTLHTKDHARNGNLPDLLNILEKELSQYHIVIIDESHTLRNRFKSKKEERLSFQRLGEAIERSKCFVVIMTGTPYSKDIDNIKNQLFLLPHTSTSSMLPGFETHEDKCWVINTLDDLKNFTVGSVLTTPFVAKHWGTAIKTGERFIDFGGEKKFIPSVHLHKVNFNLRLGNELDDVFLSGILRIEVVTETAIKSGAIIEREATMSWHSSPLALQEVLQKTINTPDDIPEHRIIMPGHKKGLFYPDAMFTHSQSKRKELLQPIVEKLAQMTFEDDVKFMTLYQILNNAVFIEKRKVVIFCERHATCVYLEQGLKKISPQLRVASLVREKRALSEDDPGDYGSMLQKQVDDIIDRFAPISNGVEEMDTTAEIDVLISGDAYGVGINLQDASVVINYDLAWTAIEPTQRAGRILRLWSEPRVAHLYVFVPSTSNDEVSQHVGRWFSLLNRHNKAKELLDMPTLFMGDSQKFTDVSILSSQENIEDWGFVELEKIDEDLQSSPIFQHWAKLEQFEAKARIRVLPDDIISVMAKGNKLLLYVLLEHEGGFHWPIFNISENRLFVPHYSDIKLLDLISCDKQTTTALVHPFLVEKYSHICINAWCEQKGIRPDEITRICAMLIIPENEDGLGRLLNQQKNAYEPTHCMSCNKKLPPHKSQGRPRWYCSPACRKNLYN